MARLEPGPALFVRGELAPIYRHPGLALAPLLLHLVGSLIVPADEGFPHYVQPRIPRELSECAIVGANSHSLEPQ